MVKIVTAKGRIQLNYLANKLSALILVNVLAVCKLSVYNLKRALKTTDEGTSHAVLRYSSLLIYFSFAERHDT